MSTVAAWLLCLDFDLEYTYIEEGRAGIGIDTSYCQQGKKEVHQVKKNIVPP